MSLKIVLALCAIISLHSVANAHPEFTPESRNLIDNVQAAIHKVEEKVLQAIETAKEKLHKIIDDFNAFAQRLLANGETQINNVVDHFLHEINQLKEEAQKLGIDVSDCVGQQEEHLKSLAPKVIGDLRKCVEDIFNQAKELVADTAAEFDTVVAQVTGLKDRFFGCGIGVSSIACLTKVLGDATALSLKLPITVAGQVAKAATLVVALQTELALCVTSQVAQITSEAGSVAYEITTCIKNKIQADPSPTLINFL